MIRFIFHPFKISNANYHIQCLKKIILLPPLNYTTLKLGVLKETKSNEYRVALSPTAVKALIGKGFSCFIESGSGLASSFSDEEYVEGGALILKDSAAVFSSADVLLKINPPDSTEISHLSAGKTWISILQHRIQPEMIEAMASKGITAYSMDAIPRISRAQSMDVLSSQSNLAGYKAVILGANEMPKIFPMLMTAAGTVKPARVLIFGVGVAGLQAIATAKRLGAIVEATDVRMETKEQAESLGAKFISVEAEGVNTAGGYATEVSEDYLKRQKEAVNKSLANADLVITTALVQGKKAPVLITEEQVKMMKIGAVIIDMAVEQGGNCALSEPGKSVHVNGVKIVGPINLAGSLANNASELYARNLVTYLTHIAKPEGFTLDLADEIVKDTLIIRDGQVQV